MDHSSTTKGERMSPQVAPTTKADVSIRPFDGPAVLVVEDELSLAESIGYMLEREQCRVVIARDGARAMQLARQERPSLVLLDLMLPELSGLDVCRQLRQESTVPIMILTARDGAAEKALGLELGADDYLTKPFSMRELVSRVCAHLRRSTVAGNHATWTTDELNTKAV